MVKEACVYFWSCATVRSGFGNESRASGYVGRGSEPEALATPEAFLCVESQASLPCLLEGLWVSLMCP